MLERTIYTPRSSFESSRLSLHTPSLCAPSLLTLPTELRVQIYEHAFSDLISHSLHIRKHPSHQWLLRAPTSAPIPSLLFVCKLVHDEAVEVLHRTCPPRVIIIDHAYRSHPEDPPLAGESNTFRLRDVRDLMPLLSSVQRLKLEVECSQSFEEQALAIALLRWLKAVLNSRRANFCMLKTLEVDFLARSCLSRPDISDTLLEAISGIETSNGKTKVWFVRKLPQHHRYVCTGWESMKIKVPPAGERRSEESEESAWRGLERVWERVQEVDRERQMQIVRGVPWSASFERLVRRWFGRPS